MMEWGESMVIAGGDDVGELGVGVAGWWRLEGYWGGRDGGRGA